MIFKKDNFYLGLILGLIAPLLGLVLYKFYNFPGATFKDVISLMLLEPGFRLLSASLSVSLLMNAVLFTAYVNTGRDNTAKGIFVTTLIYGGMILLIKTFY